MKNRSRVSRAALAAMVMMVVAMSAVSAEAAMQRAPADPIQRAGGEGRMRRAVVDGARSLQSLRVAVAGAMIKLWEIGEYRPFFEVRLRSSK